MSYLDTRDLYAEREELQARADAAADEDTDPADADPLDDDEAERLTALNELFDAIGEDAGRDGETMIPDDEFTAYAEELAEELGMIDNNAGWPSRHIDWEAAADELSSDYTSVEFDGVTYYVRLG